jgi:hypothetical protein
MQGKRMERETKREREREREAAKIAHYSPLKG